MAVIKNTEDLKFSVAHKRMFKAFTLEAHTLLPKAMPTVVKSIELLIGDGSPGTIRQTNLVDDLQTQARCLDALDIENCITKFTLIEGKDLGEKLESISYEAKFQDSGDGGCVIKTVTEYHTKGDVVFKEEDMKEGKDKFMVFYTAVVEYLAVNPNACT